MNLLFVELVVVFFFRGLISSLGPTGGVTATHVIQEFLLPDFDLVWRSPSSEFPYFGNSITKRSDHMSSDARRIYIDVNSSLKQGLLKNFYIFAHSIPGVFESWIRIQVWRPTDLEARGKKYQLVWEHRVLVDMEAFPEGVVHQFSVNASHVPIETGDMIGWTFEEETDGPIGFDPLPGAKTLYRTLTSRDFPRLGLVYEFQAEPLNAAFSVAVEVFEYDACSRCGDGTLPLEPLHEDESLPGDFAGEASKDSNLAKLKEAESSGHRTGNDVSVIVGPVLGIVVLALGVANIALYVSHRQIQNKNNRSQRNSTSKKHEETKQVRPVET